MRLTVGTIPASSTLPPTPVCIPQPTYQWTEEFCAAPRPDTIGDFRVALPFLIPEAPTALPSNFDASNALVIFPVPPEHQTMAWLRAFLRDENLPPHISCPAIDMSLLATTKEQAERVCAGPRSLRYPITFAFKLSALVPRTLQDEVDCLATAVEHIWTHGGINFEAGSELDPMVDSSAATTAPVNRTTLGFQLPDGVQEEIDRFCAEYETCDSTLMNLCVGTKDERLLQLLMDTHYLYVYSQLGHLFTLTPTCTPRFGVRGQNFIASISYHR